MTFYRQCVLEHGNTHTTAWIEERGAKLGFSVTLEDADDPTQWWKVVFVGTTRLAKDMVETRSRDYIYQRRASDA